MMRRELVINWNEAHYNVRDALGEKIRDPHTIGPVEKGWSYVTFFRPGTRGRAVLFDVDRLELIANDNGYFLPREVVTQHNKLVVTAYCEASHGSVQLYALAKLLELYAAKYASEKKHPNHGFYGKLGGIYDRAEKGRVLAIYAESDDKLLEIVSSVEQMLTQVKVPGARLEYHLANGLSAIPRLLQGFDDPHYLQSGTPFHRIADPRQFSVLLEQARGDYDHYLFSTPNY